MSHRKCGVEAGSVSNSPRNSYPSLMETASSAMGAKSGSRYGKGKGKSSQLEVADPTEDTSVVRRPIPISVTGLKDAVTVLQTGTPEVRRLLTYECDVIYECRVCRNMFRSLANFLAHKRIYCRDTYAQHLNILDLRNHVVEEATVVVEPQPCTSSSGADESWQTSDQSYDAVSGLGTRSTTIRTQIPRITQKSHLNGIIDRLSKQAETKAKNKKPSKPYNATSSTSTSTQETFPRVRVERSRKSKAMVYQTLMPPEEEPGEAEENRSIQETVREVDTLVARKAIAVLGSNGKILPKEDAEKVLATPPDPPHVQSEPDDEGSLHCKLCNMTLSTRKTLRNHMNSIHATVRNHYPCPCCDATFLKTWSVHRHLIKVHRKTSDQANQLKPVIMKKMFQKTIESISNHSQAPSEAASDSEHEDITDNREDSNKEVAIIEEEEPCRQPDDQLRLEASSTEARTTRHSSGSLRCRFCRFQTTTSAELTKHEKLCDAASSDSLQTPLLVPLSQSSPTLSVPLPHSSPSTSTPIPSPSLSLPLPLPQPTVPFSDHHRRSLSLINLRPEQPEKTIGIQVRHNYSKSKTDEKVQATVLPVETKRNNAGDKNQEKHTALEEISVREDKIMEEDKSGEEDNDMELGNGMEEDDNEDAMSTTSTSSRSKRRGERTLSPSMIEKMKPLIDAKKKQCCICKHKFRKMANVRRHVATHMEWYRYKCTLCTFKCFDKCGCIAHVKKMHPDAEAIDNVQFIQVKADDTKDNTVCVLANNAALEVADKVDFLTNGCNEDSASDDEREEANDESCSDRVSESDATFPSKSSTQSGELSSEMVTNSDSDDGRTSKSTRNTSLSRTSMSESDNYLYNNVHSSRNSYSEDESNSSELDVLQGEVTPDSPDCEPIVNGHDETLEDVVVNVPDDVDSDSSGDVRYLSDGVVVPPKKISQIRAIMKSVLEGDSEESSDWECQTLPDTLKERSKKKGKKRRRSADDGVYNEKINGITPRKHKHSMAELRCRSVEDTQGETDDDMPVLENMLVL